MSTLSHLPEPTAFAVSSLAGKDNGEDLRRVFLGDGGNGYMATDDGSTTLTGDVSDGKPSSNASSDEKKDDDKWIWVLDPMTRKLRVPLHLLVPTHATSTTGTVPSLCIAYLEGRCRHAWCRQAHVVPSAIPHLRYEALSAPTCCRFHHDPQDTSMLTNHFKHILITGNGGNNELIPANRVACTVGLRRFLVHNLPKGGTERVGAAAEPRMEPRDSDVLELPAKFICRLHLAHRCRYLDDCNNIHICRELEGRLQPPPQLLSSLNSVTTSTRTVSIGDVVYTVTPLAVGDVSDNDFNAIVEAQKIVHRNATTTPTSLTFKGTAPPYDFAVTAGGGGELSSPMPYASVAPVGAFPAFPDYRVGLCTPHSLTASPPSGQSPGFVHVESPPYLSQGAHGMGGHLRVYDVRPKAQTEAAPSSSTSSPAMNPAALEKTSVSGKTAPPKYTDAGSSVLTTQLHGTSGCGCISSSTDGGVSITTSGVNTPLAAGGYSSAQWRAPVTVKK